MENKHSNDSTTISESKAARFSLDIIQLLEGVPLSQAVFILDEARSFLLDFHTVDPSNPRYIQKFSEFEEIATGFRVKCPFKITDSMSPAFKNRIEQAVENNDQKALDEIEANLARASMSESELQRDV